MTCSSTVAAEEIQVQRLRQNEPGMPVIGNSDRVFKFADGRTDESRKTVEQPITAGLLEGKTLKMHLIDSAGNDTGPLYGINDLRRHRMVVDYDESKVMFKDKPDEWYQLPQTQKGLMLIPVTKEACDHHGWPQPSPPPELPQEQKGERPSRRRHTTFRAEACSAEACTAASCRNDP